ncbi:hypothetical protein Tco_1068560 [Tanacetum coccineum]|uniref:Uncharacterized protein n=1 Tax=Tanacetum coccineum TaxID=301880 RepID=A0ABQ5HIA2_9ASTR
MGEVNIIFSKDSVYKFEPLDPLSKSTPSKSRMWQIPENNLDNLKSTREEEDGTSKAMDPQDWLGSKTLIFGFYVSTDLEVVSLRGGKILLFFVLPEGCDLLALAELFNFVEVNIGVIATNYSLGFVKLGHVLET